MPYPTPSEPGDPVEIVRVTPSKTIRPAGDADPVVEHEELHTAGPGGIERHEQLVRDASGLEHHEQSTRNRTAERMLQLTKTTQLVWFIVGLIDGLIAIRVLLRLIGANSQNGFAQFIYGISDVFLAPFFGLTGSPQAGRYVLEVPSLLAILVYLLVGWVVVRLVWLILAPTASHSVTTYDRYRG